MTTVELDVATGTTIVHRDNAVQLMLALEESGHLTPVGLDLSGRELDFDEYEGLMSWLGVVKRRTSFYIGDAIVYGEGAYGERFAQALASTGLAEQTLLNYSYVCRNVPIERRIAGVSFGCHAEVAKLNPKEQNYWLKQCAKNDWTRDELRARMKAKRKDEKPTLPLDDDGNPDTDALVDVARAIIRDQRPHEDDASLVILPKDDISRLEAALGGI